ncbi:MAG: 2-phosphoglycerate kinase [Oscillospiraceae bacterium]|nr:2-phosphoglycerate kinase [Oscillospiraceae bacterium]
MIILIGGVGYAGKTLMAQKLLEKYKMPYLSIDDLKMGIYRSDPDCGFTPESDSETGGFELIANKLWGILKGIIMTSIENKQNLIIEGAYLFPQKINEFKEEDNKENQYSPNIISFYMGFSENYVRENFHSQVLANRSAIQYRGYEDTGTVEDYIAENAKQKKICEDYGAKYFEIDGDYEEEIKKVYEWIDEEINRKGLLHA